MLNRKGQRGNVYQPHHLEKWNPQAPAYEVFGLTFKVEKGDVKQFPSAVTTSSEQESMLPALLVKFLFPVQHFGNKLNGG